jgi:hypothetical protein
MLAIPKQGPFDSIQCHYDQRVACTGPQSPRGPGAFLYLPRSHQAMPWKDHFRQVYAIAPLSGLPGTTWKVGSLLLNGSHQTLRTP